MVLVRTVSDLKSVIARQKESGALIGFVPTMGALHEGHLSLVRQAAEGTNFVVVSIFVNPTQFNDPEDLKKYPRDLDTDMKLLSKTPCNLVFAPSVEEVYPEKDTRVFDFGNMGEVMEGKHRPGHFNGVAQVVSKLFDMVMPHKAYFGKKDFQQLAVVRSLVKQLKTDIEIISCPIVREPDGLAMSSRNVRLEPDERMSAALISKTLFEAVKMSEFNTVGEVKKWVINTIDENPYLRTEYFEIVDDEELKSIDEWDQKVNKTGCIAVICGKVRLIDNVTFS